MNVTRSTFASLDDILAATPPGRVAMFRVTRISPNVEDWVCGESVYVQDGKIFDFMTDEAQAYVTEVGLHFIDYIDC